MLGSNSYGQRVTSVIKPWKAAGSFALIRLVMHRGRVLYVRLLVVTAVILSVSLWRVHFGRTSMSKQKMTLKFDSYRTIHKINRFSPSVSVEIGIFSDGWIKYLRNPKLITLVRALGPSYLRVGGTRSDHSHFRNDKYDLKRTATTDCRGKMPNAEEFNHHLQQADRSVKQHNAIRGTSNFNKLNISYTATQFDEFMVFISCTGLKLIFGLNLLDRSGQNWNPTNAMELLDYAKSKGYRIDWELGNEPNSFKRTAKIALSAEELAERFLRMKSILKKDKWWKDSKLYGPDMSRTSRTIVKLRIFLRIAGSAIDATTFHQYYIKSANATLRDFTDRKILDSLIVTVDQVVKVVREVRSQLPIWLGETGSSSGGGADGLSNKYVAGFMLLDKLGVCASHGIDLVFRQTLLGGNYAMIDNNFNPNPDYWLTLLYKTLVGRKVMHTIVSSAVTENFHHNQKLRVYAHCTNTKRTIYKKGSVTLYYLNLLSSEKILEIKPASDRSTPKSAMAYILTPPPAGMLTSRTVYLNGKILQMPDIDTMPHLEPVPINLEKDEIVLPGKSFGFIILPDIKAFTCL